MTNVLYTSSHHVGKAMDQARELVALANEFGNVTIHVRPVAEIDALKRQVAALTEALKFYANLDYWSSPEPGPEICKTAQKDSGDRARAALKAAGLDNSSGESK